MLWIHEGRGWQDARCIGGTLCLHSACSSTLRRPQRDLCGRLRRPSCWARWLRSCGTCFPCAGTLRVGLLLTRPAGSRRALPPARQPGTPNARRYAAHAGLAAVAAGQATVGGSAGNGTECTPLTGGRGRAVRQQGGAAGRPATPSPPPVLTAAPPPPFLCPQRYSN